MYTPKQRLNDIIQDLREIEGFPTPYVFTAQDAEELGFLVDELDRVAEMIE